METSPREALPEVVTRAEFMSEPDAIDAVKTERSDLQGQVDTALDMIRTLDPAADAAEIDTAYEFRRETQDRMNTFNEMWTDFGGDAIDAAQAQVNATAFDPTSTIYARAIARLQAAENAFYARMQAENNDMQDEALVENEKRSVTVGEVEDAEGEAYEDAAILAGTRTLDADAAHDEALEEAADRAGSRVVDVNDARDQADLEREARLDAAGTRVTDVDAARDEAITEYETREGAPYDVDRGRTADVDDAYDEADIEREARAVAAGTRIDDINEAYSQALEEAAQRAGTRVEDKEEAHKQALAEHERRSSWRVRAMDRLRFLYADIGNRYREHRVATTLGAVAIAAIAGGLIAWRTGAFSGGSGSQSAAQPGTGGGHGVAPKGPYAPVDAPGSHGGQGGGIDLGPSAAGQSSELPPSTGFRYPWNWAEKAFGADEAMTKLRDMAAKAAADGHKIAWHGSGTREWLSVDGVSATTDVINKLRPYA